MIGQFNKRVSHRKMREAQWPESASDIDEVFEPRRPYRMLNVLVDAQLLASEYGEVDKISKDLLLFSLLNNDLIQCYRYADDGPPADLKPLAFEGYDWLKDKVYKGWAVAYPFQDDGQFWPVTFATEDTSFTRSAIIGNAIQVAEEDRLSRSYPGLSDEERSKKRKLDMLAHEVAEQAVQADLFITDREYLFEESRFRNSRGLTVCTVEEAITLLSLYLRAQGEYMIPSGHPKIHYRFNRGLFYWVGTREVLSESWRWFSACVYHSSGSGNDKLLGLGGSVLSRVQRAIEARDRVHIALNRTTNNDINDDALGNLDHVLMLLMGAVDASARVAHYVLALTSEEEYAAWQKEKWVKEVAKKSPKLAQLFVKGSRHRNSLEILRLLRNSVHGEALRGATLQTEGKTDTIVVLPKRDEANILASMDKLGGKAEWGYEPFAPGVGHIRPGLLVDKLIDEIIVLLNDVLRETPVEILPKIEKANLANKPPEPKAKGRMDDTFSEWNRLAIRWQLGL